MSSFLLGSVEFDSCRSSVMSTKVKELT